MPPLYLLDLLGVAVFAASGALAAGRKSMDVLGVVVIAAVTAVGGGTLRDLLLDRHPVFWMTDLTYLVVIVATALLTLAYVRYRRPPESALAIADAFGLGLFTIGGAQIAERAGVPYLIVTLMATMTAVAGGVLRDVLSAEVPLILRRGNLYATASIAGAVTYLLVKALGLGEPMAAVIGIAVVVLLRVAAIVWGLKLPVIAPREG
jgi:uncharacterized membrane protein YeiH